MKEPHISTSFLRQHLYRLVRKKKLTARDHSHIAEIMPVLVARGVYALDPASFHLFAAFPARRKRR